MIRGFIIAAGNQSRFKSETPKALVDVKGVKLLDINIRILKAVCKEVYVVTSLTNNKYFEGYNTIPIVSGKGSGDAVSKALKQVNHTEDDKCIIAWGDCLLSASVIDSIISCYASDKINVPCDKPEKPYVGISNYRDNTGEHTITKFSKFGEDTSGMYHDLSVFSGGHDYILSKLQAFKDKCFDDKTDSYIHKHNNELEFMDVFNETDAIAALHIGFKHPTLSFNTVEELEEVLKAYGN